MKRRLLMALTALLMVTAAACSKTARNSGEPQLNAVQTSSAMETASAVSATTTVDTMTPESTAEPTPSVHVPTPTPVPTEAPLLMILSDAQLTAFEDCVEALLVEWSINRLGVQTAVADMTQRDWEGLIHVIDVTETGALYEYVGDEIFGGMQFTRNESNPLPGKNDFTCIVPAYAVGEYLHNAFGPDIDLADVGRVNDGGYAYFPSSSGDDPNVVMAVGNASAVPVSADGTFRLNFATGPFEGIENYPDKQLIAQVVPAPQSPYGCYVTAFRTEPYQAGSDSGASSGGAGSFDADGFVFADSSQRYLTAAELVSLTPEMLGFARNEILARHGNIFKKDVYCDHFEACNWCEPVREGVGLEELNEVERANVALIQSFEN